MFRLLISWTDTDLASGKVPFMQKNQKEGGEGDLTQNCGGCQIGNRHATEICLGSFDLAGQCEENTIK